MQVLSLVAIMATAWFVYRYDLDNAVDSVASETIDDGVQAANMLLQELAKRETIAQSVAATTALMPDLGDEEFQHLVENLTRRYPDILNVAYAPDQVVRHVYPREENAEVIGLDYRVESQFTRGARRAMAMGETVLVGPTEIIQGGQALIMRVPVDGAAPDDDRHIGLVNLVIDIESLLEQARIPEALARIDLSAFSIDPESGSAHPVIGNATTCGSQAIVRSFLTLDRKWTFCISPIGGWPTQGPYALLIVVAAALFFGSTLAGFLVVNRLRQKEAVATNQLWESIEAINDGFVLYDENDRLVLCNSKYLEIYGRSRRIIRPGVSFKEILSYGAWNGEYAEAIGREEEWIEERMAAHRLPNSVFEEQLRDGRWIKVSERQTSSGGTVGFRVDVTDLKVALQKAEASEIASREFLDNINHEIRTPLSVIIGFIKFLSVPKALPSRRSLTAALDDGELEAIREAAEAFTKDVETQAGRVQKSAEQLLTIVQDTLDLSNMVKGTQTCAPKEVDLKSLLTECLCRFSHQAAQKGLELRIDVAPATIVADPEQLRQIVVNLVGNAVKFTDKGFVAIRSEMEDDAVLIEVEDSGPGIAPEHREKVFDRFWQVDGSVTRRHSGTGLGLAICDALTKLHGGTIWVEPGEDGGSIFCLRLPQPYSERDTVLSFSDEMAG